MKISQVTVTPRIAKSWLERNTFNRKISVSTVEKFAADMKSGMWVENGESIKFNGDGTLIDGQHRLMAIVKSGETQRLIVIKGLDKKVFSTLDTGKKRNLPDVLSIAGEKKYELDLATLTRLVYDYHRFGLQEMFTPAGKTNSHFAANNQEYLSFFNSTPEIKKSLEITLNLSNTKNCVITRSIVAFTYYVLKDKDEQQALLFLGKLIIGEGLTKNDVIYKLREKLFYYKFKKLALSRKILMALIVKTWNYWRTNHSPKSLMANEKTQIPEII